MTAEERLPSWLQAAEKQNTRVLKDLMVERGPIHYREENQSEYVAEFIPTEKKLYPISMLFRSSMNGSERVPMSGTCGTS
ncbi:MAG: hypothetical protein DMG50_02735 [Acidobacteria bacterium]|nr:MAG: hypothetical protein DMG50_02735 [Acidobacteriota bacterium]